MEISGMLSLTFVVLEAFLPQGRSHPRDKCPLNSRDHQASLTGINKTTKYSYAHNCASNPKNLVKITSHWIYCLMFWCVYNTMSLADRHMAGRQEARGSTLRYSDGAQIFFFWGPCVWSSPSLKEVPAWETWCQQRPVPRSTGCNWKAALLTAHINTRGPYICS